MTKNKIRDMTVLIRGTQKLLETSMQKARDAAWDANHARCELDKIHLSYVRLLSRSAKMKKGAKK